MNKTTLNENLNFISMQTRAVWNTLECGTLLLDTWDTNRFGQALNSTTPEWQKNHFIRSVWNGIACSIYLTQKRGSGERTTKVELLKKSWIFGLYYLFKIMAHTPWLRNDPLKSPHYSSPLNPRSTPKNLPRHLYFSRHVLFPMSASARPLPMDPLIPLLPPPPLG